MLSGWLIYPENFVKKYLRINYNDTRDHLPKKIGIIGHTHGVCFQASLELIEKMCIYIKAFERRISQEQGMDITTFFSKVKDGDQEFLERLFVYFEIVDCESIEILKDRLLSGSIDYCVVPSRVENAENGVVRTYNEFKDVSVSNKVILAASYCMELNKLDVYTKSNMRRREDGGQRMRRTNKDSNEEEKKVTSPKRGMNNKEDRRTQETLHCTSLIEPILRNTGLYRGVRRELAPQSVRCIANLERARPTASFVTVHGFNHSSEVLSSTNCETIDIPRHRIEYRLLKCKTYNLKDDQAYPKSIHRTIKDWLLQLGRVKYLKSILGMILSMALYMYSLEIVYKDQPFSLGVASISPRWLVSAGVSLSIFLVFTLLNWRYKNLIRLRKLTGYWLLYSEPLFRSSDMKQKSPGSYELPRAVRISVVDGRVLKLSIRKLDPEREYLESQEYFLNVLGPKSARIMLHYSNADLQGSRNEHGLISGVSQLSCSLKYESSRVYEMQGEFYSRSADGGSFESGRLVYFRLADEQEFNLLLSSQFVRSNGAFDGEFNVRGVPVP